MPRPTCIVLCALLALAALPAHQAAAREATPAEIAAQDAALRDVFFLDNRHGWAVGDHGVILGTEDGGRRWGQQATPIDSPLHSVWFVDRKHGWAVGGVTTPYTHSSHGVVLRTDDGGYTWRLLTDAMLPRLRRVRFFNENHGLALGEATEASPSGVYETHSGGQRWQALHADQPSQWLAGSLPAPGQGALVGANGQTGTLAGAVVTTNQPADPPAAAPRALRAVDLARDGKGWAAGANGLLLRTNDGGQAWTAAPHAPALFDWRGVAVRDQRAWLVGSPGVQVATTEDGGQRWRLRPTGVPTPLNAVRFIDDRRGWAVGDLGVILATDDGGQNWRKQRAGGGRCAALVVAPTVEAMPLELIAKLGAGEGYRTAGLVSFAEPGFIANQQDRLAEALAACGGVHAEVAAGFTLPLSVRDASAAALQDWLNSHSPGDAVAELTHLLARRLATLRPEVVLVAPSDHRGAGQLLESAVLQAARGEPDERLSRLGLVPWKPKRVLRVVQHNGSSVSGISTSDFDAQLGTSLAQRTQRHEGLIAHRPQPTPQRIGWSPLAGGAAPSASTGDPLAGLIIERGGDARRGYAQPPASGLAALKAAALKQPEFDELLAHHAGGSEWANSALQLTAGLEPEAGAQRLLDLATGYRGLGRQRLAADTYYLMARRYSDHALAEHALVWLLKYYSGSETARAARQSHDQSQLGAPLANVSAEHALPEPSVEWAQALKLEEHQGRALTLGEYVEQARPAAFADPALRLALAAAARRRQQPDRAKLLLAALSRPSTPAAYQQCVRDEAWLLERDRGQSKPALGCVAATQRPMLDGALEEPFWRLAPVAAMGDPAAEPAPDASSAAPTGAGVRIACDNRFLYLAITADRLPGAAYPDNDAARPRDADLRGYDRVSVRIDVDRDYATAFELTLDCRGWTHDACWGNAAWNPHWYVARKLSETSWTVEAAIPLEELVESRPGSGAAWAVSLERHAPGRVPKTWTGAAHADNSPDAYGLLLFPVVEPPVE